DEVLGTSRLAAYQRNAVVGRTNVLNAWTCTVATTIYGSTGPLGVAWVAASELADPVKKASDLFLYHWFTSVFDLPAAAFTRLNGPFPPFLVVWFEGDLIDFVAAAAPEIARQGPASAYTLKVQEASALVHPNVFNGGPVQYFQDGQTSLHDNVAVLALSGAGGPIQTQTVSLGYDAAVWLLTQDGVSEWETTAAAEEGDASITIASTEGEGLRRNISDVAEGDVLLLRGAETETVQVIGVAAGPADGSSTLTLARPLTRGLPGGIAIERLSPGTVAPPPPPILEPYTGTEPPARLNWIPDLLSTPASYDLQVASDTTSLTLLLERSGVDSLGVTVDPFAFEIGTTYHWRVRATHAVGTGAWTLWQEITPTAPVAAEETPENIERVSLAEPYPNPARESVTIPYALPANGPVRLAVFDAVGRQIVRLADGVQSAGHHEVTLPTDRLPAGVYVVRLSANGTLHTQRLTVVR
ncbi:MAG: T9SS type A sorting domain-containing protein, partial [Bacteroidota bacterium]